MPEIKTHAHDHPLTFAPADRLVQGLQNGHLVADSGQAMICQETAYAQVVYFSKADVEMVIMHPAAPWQLLPR